MLFLDKTPTLSPLELDIYKYISNNISQVCYMRIRDLAEATHTSTSTILRFCEKFECSGYTEFRIKLQLYEKMTAQQQASTMDEEALISFLSRAKTPSFSEQIDAAVELLKGKELVLFLGVGSSNVIAQYGALYFSSIFNFSLRIDDPTTFPINYISQKLADKVCIIALSVSGETPEVIHYLTNPKFRDSSILSITNSANSTVAQLSDVNISYYIGTESLNENDITSQVPALYILERLAKEMGNIDLTS